MNKLFHFLLITVLSGFLISCQKDYSPYNVPEIEKDVVNNLQGYFKCKINGEDFSSEFQHALFFVEEGTGFRTLVINGSKYDDERVAESNKSISLSIGIYEGPKWYTMMYPGGSASLTIMKKDQPTINFMTRTTDEFQFIEITEDNGKFIKGKFNVTVHLLPGSSESEYVELTEGEFHVPIITR